MSGAGLFTIGALVTLIVAGAGGLLVYAEILDGRDADLARVGRGDRSGPATSAMNLFETALADGQLSTLVMAIDRAGLTEVLADRGPYTVFAPRDDAFARLPEGTVDWLLEDPETLVDIVNYHVVPGRLTAAAMVQRPWAATVQGEDLAISHNGAVRVDGAHVVQEDIEASNGVIHVIDRVLLPTRI